MLLFLIVIFVCFYVSLFPYLFIVSSLCIFFYSSLYLAFDSYYLHMDVFRGRYPGPPPSEFFGQVTPLPIPQNDKKEGKCRKRGKVWEKWNLFSKNVEHLEIQGGGQKLPPPPPLPCIIS